MVYIISIIVVCTICVSLRYLENKRINDPPHYNPSNKPSDKSDVKSIQKKLVNAGYPIKIGDGYGVKTAEAVKKFQNSCKTTAMIRQGTTYELEAIDPVLGDGEIVFDNTKHALKIGDGKKTFTELDYIYSGLYGDISDMK